MDAEEAIGVASAIQEVMGWFNSRLVQLKERYPDKRTKEALCAISSACHEDFIDLNALLQAPRASRATTIGKWIAMACEELNQANEVELGIADLQESNLLAEEIKSIDARIRAGSLSEDERIHLLQERETKFDLLLDMSRNTSNRQAVLSEASRIINTNTAFQTRTGEKQGLTPEQEEAMMVTGKSIIAAGAGSGKTRVLASKIAYTIQELGVSPDNIIATTFSKEAAGELQKRALKYSDGAAVGKFVGKTTHSIGNSVCIDAKVFRGNEALKRVEANLLKAAIAQVTLRPTAIVGEVVPTPFIDTSKATSQAPVIQETLSEEDAFQQELKDLLIRTTQAIADKALWAESKGYSWARYDIQDLGSIIVGRQGNDAVLVDENHPAWDDPRFRAMINSKIKAKRDGSPSRGTNSLQKARPFPGFPGKFASDKNPRQHFEVPLNQWFNLGIDPTQMVNKDINEKEYAKFIGIAKSKLQSPTELWFEGGDRQAVCSCLWCLRVS